MGLSCKIAGGIGGEIVGVSLRKPVFGDEAGAEAIDTACHARTTTGHDGMVTGVKPGHKVISGG